MERSWLSEYVNGRDVCGITKELLRRRINRFLGKRCQCGNAGRVVRERAHTQGVAGLKLTLRHSRRLRSVVTVSSKRVPVAPCWLKATVDEKGACSQFSGERLNLEKC